MKRFFRHFAFAAFGVSILCLALGIAITSHIVFFSDMKRPAGSSLRAAGLCSIYAITA